MTKKEEVGLIIKTMRLSRNLTQQQLADKLGQTQSSITMYETGRRVPDLETLEALADIFNVSLDDFSPQEDGKSGYTVHVKTNDARILVEGFEKFPESARKTMMDMFYMYSAKYTKGNDDT